MIEAVVADDAPALSLEDIRAAALRLQGQILDTPCVPSRTLSAITGCARETSAAEHVKLLVSKAASALS